MKKLTTFALLALTGCASTQMAVQPPSAAMSQNRTKEIARTKDAVWNDAVAKLGQRFFVINNLDKSSGLINLSYGGDPEEYVDCGIVTITTKGPGGGTYSFKGAAADTYFSTPVPIPPYNIPTNAPARRQMELEGRVNLIFEAIGTERTRVTAATRYILTRKVSSNGNVLFPSSADTISFNSNNASSFAPGRDGQSLKCVATGALEDSLLEVIN